MKKWYTGNGTITQTGKQYNAFIHPWNKNNTYWTQLVIYQAVIFVEHFSFNFAVYGCLVTTCVVISLNLSWSYYISFQLMLVQHSLMHPVVRNSSLLYFILKTGNSDFCTASKGTVQVFCCCDSALCAYVPYSRVTRVFANCSKPSCF